MVQNLRLIDDKQNNEYKFEIWRYGKLVDTIMFDDINPARRFYICNCNIDYYTLKLFINGERIPIIEVCEALEFTKAEKVYNKISI